MNPFWMLRFLCAASLLAVSGCATNRESAQVAPDADLSRLKKLYVVKLAPDGRGVNELITAELAGRGYRASTGPKGAEPADADAVVTYQDRWRWDITMYMLELRINFREPRSGRLLAAGTSHHTSLTRRTPEEMVAEVLSNLLSESAKRSRSGSRR